MALSSKDKDTINMFAAHAASGIIRDGLSLMGRKNECLDIAEASFELASAMFIVSKKVEKIIETL
tara:strand:+ start:395 stop:589 length:195 start_codon:yes stop_codon:yes gene_type:complete